MTMIAIEVEESGFSQKPTWRDVAVNRALWRFVPSDIESEELREELQLTVREIVVNPPSHRLPGDALSHPIDQPGHDDRRQRAHMAFLVASIPDVAGAVLLVRRAAQPMTAPKLVNLRRTIGG